MAAILPHIADFCSFDANYASKWLLHTVCYKNVAKGSNYWQYDLWCY